MEHLPFVAIPLITRLVCSLLVWLTLNGVELINEIPVHFPKQHIFKNTARAQGPSSEVHKTVITNCIWELIG